MRLRSATDQWEWALTWSVTDIRTTCREPLDSCSPENPSHPAPAGCKTIRYKKWQYNTIQYNTKRTCKAPLVASESEALCSCSSAAVVLLMCTAATRPSKWSDIDNKNSFQWTSPLHFATTQVWSLLVYSYYTKRSCMDTDKALKQTIEALHISRSRHIITLQVCLCLTLHVPYLYP